MANGDPAQAPMIAKGKEHKCRELRVAETYSGWDATLSAKVKQRRQAFAVFLKDGGVVNFMKLHAKEGPQLARK